MNWDCCDGCEYEVGCCGGNGRAGVAGGPADCP